MDGDAAVAYGVARGLGQGRDLDPPLHRQPGFDDGSAARAVPDRVHIGAFLGDDAAVGAQGGDYSAAGFEPIESLERSGGGDDRPFIHHGQRGQVVALADLEVVRVVGGGDFDCASTEFGVDVLVGDDRDVPASEWQLDLTADEVAVAVVVGMHGDGGVTEHGFSAGGGDHDRVLAVAVTDRDQFTVEFLVVDLDIGDRRRAARAPVDDSLGPIDQFVIVEALEDRLDRP